MATIAGRNGLYPDTKAVEVRGLAVAPAASTVANRGAALESARIAVVADLLTTVAAVVAERRRFNSAVRRAADDGDRMLADLDLAIPG